MATATKKQGTGIALPPLGDVLAAVQRDWQSPKKLSSALDAWVKAQHPALDVLAATIGGGTQGAFLGGVMGTLTKADPAASSAAFAGSPEMQKQMASLQAGGPWAQARNFAVMTGVNAGIACAYRRWKGEDDVYGTMCAAFGSGAAFSLVSGMGSAGNPAQAAFTTGVAFAVFQGGFHKIGQAFSGGGAGAKPEEFARTSYMLQTLGLSKYDKAVKKAGLTDETLLLWTEAALADAKVPPGPRLRILAHLDRYRRAGGKGGGMPAPPAGAALEGGVVAK